MHLSQVKSRPSLILGGIWSLHCTLGQPPALTHWLCATSGGWRRVP